MRGSALSWAYSSLRACMPPHKTTVSRALTVAIAIRAAWGMGAQSRAARRARDEHGRLVGACNGSKEPEGEKVAQQHGCEAD